MLMLEEKKVYERLCGIFGTHVIEGTLYKKETKECLYSVNVACEGMKTREKGGEGRRGITREEKNLKH